jgi:acetyl esterase/lipase
MSGQVEELCRVGDTLNRDVASIALEPGMLHCIFSFEGATPMHNPKPRPDGEMYAALLYSMSLQNKIDSVFELGALYRSLVRMCIVATFLLVPFSVAWGQCPELKLEPSFSTSTSFAVQYDTLTFKKWPNIRLFIVRPKAPGQRFPAIYFCHKYAAHDPEEYQPLLDRLASEGHVVIFPSYHTFRFSKLMVIDYARDLRRLDSTICAFRECIDTSRIGFIGHGFGAGMTPAICHRYLKTFRWGQQGSFIYVMSPWYTMDMDRRQLAAIGGPLDMVVQFFEDDNANSPKIGIELFNTIGISPERKICMVLFSDRKGDCRLLADNTTPLSSADFLGQTNVYDVQAIERVAKALCAAGFRNDSAARKFLFDDPRHTRSIPVAKWSDGTPVHPMIATSTPEQTIAKSVRINQWKSRRNTSNTVSKFRESRREIANKYKNILGVVRRYLHASIQFRLDPDSSGSFANPIDSGYGADGPYAVTRDSFETPLSVANQGRRNYEPHWVNIFSPLNAVGPLPAVIVLHGYRGQDPQVFEPFVSHIVSTGCIVVYPTYPYVPNVDTPEMVLDKYNYIKTGIDEAVRRLAAQIDTTRIGVVGQSFGAGAVPWCSYYLFVDKGWGGNGAFFMMTAPWYCYSITNDQLARLPAHVRHVMVIFDDDRINDHQMAVDIFNNLALPLSQRDFITLYSDANHTESVTADHFVPYGSLDINGRNNFLDYFGLFKYIDGLTDLCFFSDSLGNDVSLGNGSPVQCYMGQWDARTFFRPAEVTDHPCAQYSEYFYMFPWNAEINPRR